MPEEVPDTLVFSFRWRCPGGLPGFPFYPRNQAPSIARVASKRGQKDRPFDNYPEVCARPTIAAQDP